MEIQRDEESKNNIAFFVALSEYSNNGLEDLKKAYDVYVDLIRWLKVYCTFSFGEDIITLTFDEIEEVILDSYSSFPDFSLKNRVHYVIGNALVLFTEKKVIEGCLSREMQGEDTICLFSNLPFYLQTIETLLGTKEGLSFVRQEYQYEQKN